MRHLRTFSTVALTLIALLAPAFIIQNVKADNGTANVYILMLPGVGGSWIDSCEQVRDGVIEACMLKGEFIHQNVPRAHPKQEGANYPPYYSATPSVITSWMAYRNKIIYDAGLIIVNTHGEILPVPNGYTKEEWVDQISETMLTRRITWVHVAMYPFFYVKYENGTFEEWGENGFKHFMGRINKGNVNCWLPENASVTETTRIERSDALKEESMIGNWCFGDLDTDPINKFWHAELGRPLKWSDFKDYLIMPLYEINDTGSLDVYMTGAVIAYVKAGQRYLTDYGCGVYVHLGVRYFYDPGSNQMNNTDFGRGFIGTAAALWVEANRFKPSDSSWEKSVGGRDWKTTVFAHPTAIGFWKDGSYIYARLGFGVHGIYKFPEEREGMGARFKEARFSAWVDSSDWSDVRIKAGINSPALSKQAIGFGTELSDFNTEKEEEFRGLATSTIIKICSKISGVGYLFDAIGGLKLLGQWLGFAGVFGDGIDEYVTTVDIGYYTSSLNSQPIGTYVYAETSSIVVVDVRIPTSTRSRWMILPLTYYVNVAVETGILGDLPYWIGPIQKTIEIAIYFDRGEGQEDAGMPGDAGNDCASAREIGFPGSYHGYLSGGDDYDWYSFTMDSGKSISIYMSPPPFVDFDLALFRPDDTLKACSLQDGAGITEIIQRTTDCAGEWKIRIWRDQGSGVYSLKLGWQYLTVKTKETTGGNIYNVKVWIDYDQYYSPATVSLDSGTHILEVKSRFSRGVSLFTFERWSDGETANPRTIPFNGDGNVTYTALYKVEYQGTCPTLFVWNGSHYVYETLLDIHAESDITVQHQIQQTLVRDGLFYKPQLRELDNFTSHIDQVKLYAVDHDGKWHTCPLILAEHNNTYVTLKLRFDDDKRVDLVPSEIINLKFRPSIPHKNTAYFTFEINGYNKKFP